MFCIRKCRNFTLSSANVKRIFSRIYQMREYHRHELFISHLRYVCVHGESRAIELFFLLISSSLPLVVSLGHEWHEEEALVSAKLLSLLQGIWQLLVGRLWWSVQRNLIGNSYVTYGCSSILQCCVKTFLLSFKNHSLAVLLPTPKLHYGVIFQPAVPET